MPPLLHDLSVSIVAATILAFIARLLKQPVLLAYVAAGVLIGPIGFKQVHEKESIETLANLGLAFLMFIVGLEIDVKKLLAAGKPALIVTTVQVAGSAVFGWAAARLLGYGGLAPVYIGGAVAFSSTMIVVKLLADRSELDTVPGRITLAILLLQDVFAIVALAIQPNLGGDVPVGTLALAGLKGLGLFGGTLLVAWLALPPLFRSVAKSPEIVLLAAISWCFIVCFAAVKLEFSLAMGALIAGVSISAQPYTLDVVAKIRSLRDFFVTLFFVSLGMLMAVPTAKILLAAAAMSVVVVLSRFLIVWPMLRLMGNDNRTGVLSSIHTSQISEFGLLLALMGSGMKPAHIDQDTVTMIVIMLIITATASTYMIQFSHKIAAMLVRGSEATPFKNRLSPDGADQEAHPAEIMLIGCHRVGGSLVPLLQQAGLDFSVVDFNPDLHRTLTKRGVRCLYGDISHLDTLEHAGVEHAKILIASISDDFLRGISNQKLLEVLRHASPHAKIIVAAETAKQAVALYEAGATHVILPRELVAADVFAAMQSLRGADGAANRGKAVGHDRQALAATAAREI